GHEVAYVEAAGWADACYDPSRHEMTDDAAYGIAYLRNLLRPHGLEASWCFIDAAGAVYGWPRERLADFARGCDLYLNLSNINDIAETRLCRRRVLVDTDPVFTQIRAHGL